MICGKAALLPCEVKSAVNAGGGAEVTVEVLVVVADVALSTGNAGKADV